MKSTKRLLAAAPLGVLTVATATASAAPSARLVYVRDVGAEECPAEGALRTAVAARLGYEPFFPHAPATLYAEVSRTKVGYHATVKLVDGTNRVVGARELEHASSSCADILDAMALTMSIAIDPGSLLGPRSGEPPAPPAPASGDASADGEPPVATSEARDVAPTPEAPRTAPDVTIGSGRGGAGTTIEPIVGIALAAWMGAAPSMTGGALLFGGGRVGAFGAFLEGRADLAASRDVPQGSISTSFLGGSLVPCWLPGYFVGCGVVTVGRLGASAAGIARPQDDSGLHTLAGARAGVAIPMSARFDLRVMADLLYALAPTTLRIDPSERYELPRMSLGLSVGTGLHFP